MICNDDQQNLPQAGLIASGRARPPAFIVNGDSMMGMEQAGAGANQFGPLHPCAASQLVLVRAAWALFLPPVLEAQCFIWCQTATPPLLSCVRIHVRRSLWKAAAANRRRNLRRTSAT